MFEWKTASAADKVSYLGLRLQSQSANLTTYENYFDGTQPAAYLAPELVSQLQDRVASVNVNYCRLLVQTLVERITLTGFRLDGATEPDAKLWQVWRRNQMKAELNWLLRDLFVYGRGYVLVWTDEIGNVSLSVESPRQVVAYRNPVTRAIEGSVKQWSTFDDVLNQQTAWSVLYEPDAVTTFSSVSPAAVNSIPSTGWRVIDRQPNPLGVVPMVEFSNRNSVLDFYGSCEFAPIMGLQDALNKTVLDSLIASEYGAFARRWFTGFTVPEDDDGNPVSPFINEKGAVWTDENVDTKFGQFEAQSLQGFDVQSNLLTRHIASISGLPEFSTGTGTANPTSADMLRAAEVSLTAKAAQKLDLLTPSFALVGALIVAIQTGRPVAAVDIEPLYADLENRSSAMQSDAFTKLVAAGVPMDIAAEKTLSWSPQDAARLTDIGNSNGNTDNRAA